MIHWIDNRDSTDGGLEPADVSLSSSWELVVAGVYELTMLDNTGPKGPASVPLLGGRRCITRCENLLESVRPGQMSVSGLFDFIETYTLMTRRWCPTSRTAYHQF
jgi:hypothetical protein